MEVCSLENIGEDILEELILPERQGILGSRRLRSTLHGVLRETRVAFCDQCGRRLEEDKPTVICCICGKKLCASQTCALDYERRHYCEDDVQAQLPLTKHGHMILSGMIQGLVLGDIKDLAHLSSDEVQSALNQLLEQKYVEKRGVSLFSSYRIRDRGILAWKTYEPAYSRDGNVSHFESELTNYLQEKEAKACQQERRWGK